MNTVRHRIRISGRVQGVGFRPFIHRLATELKLYGYICNKQSHVVIDIQGSKNTISRFHQALSRQLPAEAEIIDIEIEAQNSPRPLFTSFEIQTSTAENDSQDELILPKDRAICQACLDELHSSQDRRYQYPFISCTQCGPRYSILKQQPFERAHTSLVDFPLCAHCEKDYSDPKNRRFHAQTISCHECGPKLSLYDTDGIKINSENPVQSAYQAIAAGQIVAIKNTSGIHLVCDAQNTTTVQKLRSRKQRPDKPFAIMGLNARSFSTISVLPETSISLFNNQAAPIVLTPKKQPEQEWIVELASGTSDIGIMRPYSALYSLLFHEAMLAHGIESFEDQLDVYMVVTSANRSGEPLLSDNQACLSKLHGMADLFLLHDLNIENALDDSVVRAESACNQLRSGRGYAPMSIGLIKERKSSGQARSNILALGAHLKNSICLLQGSHAFVSPYIGDLATRTMRKHFRTHVHKVLAESHVRPDAIACDQHPDFYSSLEGEQLARQFEARLIKIQHHHAHIASVMAEHQLTEPCLGLALDGFGLGEDDTAWGGELFYVNNFNFDRRGHLVPLPLPGADLATREPERIGFALLHQIDDQLALSRYPRHAQQLLPLLQSHSCSSTTSLGRWFDACSALLGFEGKTSFEGQAAMYLECLANRSDKVYYPRGLVEVSENLNLYPLMKHLLEMSDMALSAKVFHIEVAYALAHWLMTHSKHTQTRVIVCSGGCFQNRILTNNLIHFLNEYGFRAYFPTTLCPNDSGLSLGQAVLAQHTYDKELT